MIFPSHKPPIDIDCPTMSPCFFWLSDPILIFSFTIFFLNFFGSDFRLRLLWTQNWSKTLWKPPAGHHTSDRRIGIGALIRSRIPKIEYDTEPCNAIMRGRLTIQTTKKIELRDGIPELPASWLRVVRGGSGAKAHSLAARPVADYTIPLPFLFEQTYNY